MEICVTVHGFLHFDPVSPSVPGPSYSSYSSYRLPPVVMSPVVSVYQAEGAPTLSLKKKRRKENINNHLKTTEEFVILSS